MTSQTVRTPRQVFDEMIRATTSGDWESFVALYPDDAVIEMPFAPPGVPVVSDGVAMRERIMGMLDRGRPWNFDAAENVTVHETTDPEVIVAEYTLRGTIAATGAPLELSYAMVITVRGGQIVHSRDYGNPLAASAALGRLADVVAAYQEAAA
ncbi:MAG TPA: nuclear transport factor 2 family protein [Pseudonocardiaceae bacterium]|jgi:ketosteroid isomerase-like protein|nr:nuclear transport factor 2 family protein [Pseudonocardiaceae bacterium]